MPDSELIEPYRFDYASVRDLNEILKGIAFTEDADK